MPNTQRARGFSMYRELLQIPHAGILTLTGVIAQYCAPMVGLGIVLGVKASYASFTLAGAAAAAQAVVFAVSAPIVGRLLDRYGQRRIGVPLTAIWLALIIHLMVVLALRAPEWVVIAASAGAGVSIPFGSMLRGRWKLILNNDATALNSAFSMVAVCEELMWATGVPLATLMGTLVSPLLSIGFGAACAVACGLRFVTSPHYAPPALVDVGTKPGHTEAVRQTLLDHAERADESENEAAAAHQADTDLALAGQGGRRASAMSERPMWTFGLVALLITMFGYGAFQSTISLSVIAMADEVHQKEWSGFVLACFSSGAMFGALGYGMRQWKSALWKRFIVFLFLLAVGCSSLYLAGPVRSMLLVAVLLFASGLVHAPTLVNINNLLSAIVPPTRFTEGMALLGAMWVTGSSVANIVTGRAVDVAGSMGGFTVTVAFSFVAMLVAVVALPSIRREAGAAALSAQ